MFRRLILYILSILYASATSLRNFFYQKGIFKIYKVDLPVVSVGNLSVGGNAKTPICIFLAQKLAERGYKPVILSRGYKGKLSGPHLVNIGDQVSQVGDEPLIIAKHFPVVISKDRVAGARFIQKNNLGTLIILDDGFQHRRLFRNFDLISVNISDQKSIRDFIDGYVLPLGRFREKRQSALQRADALIFSLRKVLDKDELPKIEANLLDCLPYGIKTYRSYVQAEGFFDNENKLVDPKTFDNPLAFCGIANPQAFFSTLKSLGLKIVAEFEFADHYNFNQQDIERLKTLYPNCQLICTEKDRLKLPNLDNLFYLKISTKIIPEDALIVQILKAIS